MTVHVIWHKVDHPRISDDKDVVGVVLTGYEDAQKVVDILNEHDENSPLFGNNYWREEFVVLTPENALKETSA